jgi:hypothetical protein
MATEKMIEVIADALTNEIIEIELSDERIAQIEADRASIALLDQEKKAVRDSALAKLAALGLTEEEVAAL